MRRIHQDTEQLSEAAVQLRKQTPTGARLALMLLDNLAELLMYRKVLYLFSWDDYFSDSRGSKYSSTQRRKVKKYFDEKVRFLMATDANLSAEEAEVLKLGHRLRNEAYHQGKIRDSIMVDMADVYLDVVCKIWPRLWDGAYSFSGQSEVSDFLARYGLSGSLINDETLTQVARAIRGRVEKRSETLQSVLGRDLRDRISDLLDSVDYLSTGWSGSPPPDLVLKRLQFFEPIADEPSPNIETHEQFREHHENLDRRLEMYIPLINIAKLEEWCTTASTWGGDPDRVAILKFYSTVDRELINIEELVYESVFKFDEWVNMEVKAGRLRGE